MREVSAEDPVNPNRALWEKGDFTRIARTMRKSGEALTNSLGIAKGLKILDLGCGAIGMQASRARKFLLRDVNQGTSR